MGMLAFSKYKPDHVYYDLNLEYSEGETRRGNAITLIYESCKAAVIGICRPKEESTVNKGDFMNALASQVYNLKNSNYEVTVVGDFGLVMGSDKNIHDYLKFLK